MLQNIVFNSIMTLQLTTAAPILMNNLTSVSIGPVAQFTLVRDRELEELKPKGLI